jgi:hypothetical protein
MFGFPSSPKLILILLVVGVVWWLIRRQAGNHRANTGGSAGETRSKTASRKAESRPESRPIEDMVPCPKCGAYVAKNADHVCAKANTGR